MTTWVEKGVTYALAAATTIAGAGSLVLFGWFLGKVREPVRVPWSDGWGWLGWDTALCLIFFVQHSGMVRLGFRRWLERWTPEHLHGVAYTLASAAALVLLCGLWQPSGTEVLVMGGAARVVCRVLSGLALIGFAWAFAALGGFDAFGTGAMLSRGSGPRQAVPVLAVKGPYRWVRHPFYLLCLVLLWAVPVMTLDRLLLNALFTVWIVIATRWEERDLVAVFGEAYRRHQRTVPMLLPWKIPRAV